MPCNQDCDQGRRCDCQPDRSVDRAMVVISVLLILCLFSIGFGLYKLINRNKGQECAVTLQFNNNVKATYIGKTV
jgi:hypothetical protein